MAKKDKCSKQMTIEEFSKNIAIFKELKEQLNETETTSSTVKLTFTQTATVDKFCEVNGFDKSAVIRNSITFYFKFFDQADKMIRYSKAIASFMESLP